MPRKKSHAIEEEREIETRMASVLMFVVQKKEMGFSKKDQRKFFILLNKVHRKDRFWWGGLLIDAIGDSTKDLTIDQLASVEKEVIKKKEDCFMEKFKNVYIKRAEKRGVTVGVKKGREEERRAVALRLLQEGMKTPFVAKISRLTIKEIKGLQLKKLESKI